jgi:hypothetical protein
LENIMAGVLTLGQWLGGPDNVKVESTFPSSQKTYSYDFNQNITGWTFKADYQTVVVDAIAYTRDGEPNFADSTVIGYFPSGVISTSSFISVQSTNAGLVNVTHPSGLYPEQNGILPDSRANVPLLVVSLAWTTNASPPVTNIHRIAKIMAWEPGVLPVDPTTLTTTNFVSLVATI